MDAAEDEDPAALGGQRIDDRFHLAKGFAGMELRLDILALQQLKIGDGLETDHLVPPCRVDHQVARDGEQIRPASRHILPIFSGIGTREHLCHHIFQLMGGRKYPPQPPPKRSFLWQDDRLEPFQLSANSVHVDPLMSAAPLLPFSYV